MLKVWIWRNIEKITQRVKVSNKEVVESYAARHYPDKEQEMAWTHTKTFRTCQTIHRGMIGSKEGKEKEKSRNVG